MQKIIKTVLVTGASGYMASWIVKQLLKEGYIVHACVRDLNNTTKIAHLKAMQQEMPDNLKLFECDLLKDGSFEPAMQGCDVVMHTASPYFLSKPKDLYAQLINPAVQGTKNVLNSVNKTKSVKRVILTSSIVALYSDAKSIHKKNHPILQESDLNTNKDITYNTYAYSKTLAEAAAWEMQRRQQHWSLVTIHPGAIFGPSLSKRADATSIEMLMSFLNGTYKSGVPRLWLGIVDVRDVAAIHCLAMQASAQGKYIAVGESLRLLEIAQLLKRQEYDFDKNLPTKELPKVLMWLVGPLVGLQRKYIANNVNYPIEFDTTRSKKELGINYRLTQETLKDHVEQILRDNVLANE